MQNRRTLAAFLPVIFLLLANCVNDYGRYRYIEPSVSSFAVINRYTSESFAGGSVRLLQIGGWWISEFEEEKQIKLAPGKHEVNVLYENATKTYWRKDTRHLFNWTLDHAWGYYKLRFTAEPGGKYVLRVHETDEEYYIWIENEKTGDMVARTVAYAFK
jgi:hypothetical protein